MFLSNRGVWLRCAKGLARFSVTCLSVLPGKGQMLVITWSQTESDQRKGRGRRRLREGRKRRNSAVI